MNDSDKPLFDEIEQLMTKVSMRDDTIRELRARVERNERDLADAADIAEMKERLDRHQQRYERCSDTRSWWDKLWGIGD